MQYQLPSGKVIYLSTEEYLQLSDEELHQLAHSGYGENPSYSQTFSGKIEKQTAKKDIELDYQPDSEELESNEKLNLDNLIDE
jgi:hypothetical protein